MKKLGKVVAVIGVASVMACTLCACGDKLTPPDTSAPDEPVIDVNQGDPGDTDGTEDPYIGVYVEPVAKRGSVAIADMGDGTYQVDIHWPESAYKSCDWVLHGKFDDADVLTYDDCVKTVYVYDEDGNPIEENGQMSPYNEYENGTGTITWDGDTITWVDDMENGSESEFVLDEAL